MAALLQVGQAQAEADADLLRRLLQLAARQVQLAEPVDDVVRRVAARRRDAHAHTVHVHGHLRAQDRVFSSCPKNKTPARALRASAPAARTAARTLICGRSSRPRQARCDAQPFVVQSAAHACRRGSQRALPLRQGRAWSFSFWQPCDLRTGAAARPNTPHTYGRRRTARRDRLANPAPAPRRSHSRSDRLPAAAAQGAARLQRRAHVAALARPAADLAALHAVDLAQQRVVHRLRRQVLLHARARQRRRRARARPDVVEQHALRRPARRASRARARGPSRRTACCPLLFASPGLVLPRPARPRGIPAAGYNRDPVHAGLIVHCCLLPYTRRGLHSAQHCTLLSPWTDSAVPRVQPSREEEQAQQAPLPAVQTL